MVKIFAFPGFNRPIHYKFSNKLTTNCPGPGFKIITILKPKNTMREIYSDQAEKSENQGNSLS